MIGHPRQAVLQANLAFYEAFAAGDVAAMDQVWARTHLVACIHPGWQVLHGRDQVMASWRAILDNDAPAIRCEEAKAFVLDESAFVTCVEHVGDSELVATNIFAREGGLWKMVHHQAGPFSQRVLPVEIVPPKNELN